VKTFTRVGLIVKIVISIIIFLVVSLRNTDGTVIQNANSKLKKASLHSRYNSNKKNEVELKNEINN